MGDADSANARRAASTSHVWGYVVVLGAAACFISSMYMMVFSKLLLFLDEPGVNKKAVASEGDGGDGARPEASGLFGAIERDIYYCYLIPLTIPVTILACYANWVSLKFFRHN